MIKKKRVFSIQSTVCIQVDEIILFVNISLVSIY